MTSTRRSSSSSADPSSRPSARALLWTTAALLGCLFVAVWGYARGPVVYRRYRWNANRAEHLEAARVRAAERTRFRGNYCRACKQGRRWGVADRRVPTDLELADPSFDPVEYLLVAPELTISIDAACSVCDRQAPRGPDCEYVDDIGQ